MHIVVNLDVMLARRKMSSNELASHIGHGEQAPRTHHGRKERPSG